MTEHVKRFRLLRTSTCILLVAFLLATIWFLSRKFGVGIGQAVKSMVPDLVPSDRYDRFSKGGDFQAGGVSVSHHNRFLVYSSAETGHGDIYRIQLDAHNKQRLTSSLDCETEPQLSPDDSEIVFTRAVNKLDHIWIMSQDGSNQRQLTDGDGEDILPKFSGDGRKIYFIRLFPHDNQVNGFEMERSGNRVQATKQILSEATSDGKTLYYPSRVPGDQSPTIESHVFVNSMDGTRVSDLGPGDSPAVSPSGRLIAFLRAENRELWLMGSNGKSRRRIRTRGYIDTGMGFSEDSREIVFIEELEPKLRYISAISVDGTGYHRIDAVP